MESSRFQEGIMPWGTLNVRLPLGWRLSQMEGLKSFTLFGGPTRFSLLGGWGESLPHWHQTHPQLFIPRSKGSSPQLNDNFSCYHPIKTSFLAVFIALVPFLSYLQTLCTHWSC